MLDKKNTAPCYLTVKIEVYYGETGRAHMCADMFIFIFGGLYIELKVHVN